MKFREYMMTVTEEDRQARIQSVVNSPNMVLFFTKDDSVYGAPEDSRVIFARLKSKRDEDGEKWKKDADFMAINLSSLLSDDKISQTILGKKDLRKIKVIDKEEVERRLIKAPKSSSKHSKVISIVMPSQERER